MYSLYVCSFDLHSNHLGGEKMENAQKYDIVPHITITKTFISLLFLPTSDYPLIILQCNYLFSILQFFSQQSYSSRPMFVAFVFVHILHLLYDVQPFLQCVVSSTRGKILVNITENTTVLFLSFQQPIAATQVQRTSCNTPITCSVPRS